MLRVIVTTDDNEVLGSSSYGRDEVVNIRTKPLAAAALVDMVLNCARIIEAREEEQNRKAGE
jgi:hypothetical protein